MKLRCKNCKIELTTNLVELLDYNLVNSGKGNDYLPTGYFISNNKANGFHIQQGILVNLKDLVHTKHHFEKSRANGCCGLDGLDGINTLCINQHEIGTEHSDCWMPHYFCFEPELVEWFE